ncbi:MAG: RNA polymerase sigma factor RpoD/SigA [Planctomycetota bacterium]|nr:MAG: RNA polymerase sigma factor RpoD/SigA [Planctomycetota bacterium]
MQKTTIRKKPVGTVQNPLETYLKEINETPLLNADQEKDLARRIAQGDMYARDHMVRANLRLVVNITRGYTGKGLPIQDLIEEGNLGLLRAVEGFDPDMNTRFSTYASYWIKQSIRRSIINSGKTIRIPAYMVELLTKWRRANAQLSDELGRSPSVEEVARHLELPARKLKIVKKAIQLYNATPQSEELDSDWSMGDAVADERHPGPEEEMLENDNLKHVNRMLETMDPREATILRMRFGLDDGEPRTLKEIGELLGLTRERVRQIESEALERLNKGLTGE